MPLNRAELVRRLEALEKLVAPDPEIPGDVERFMQFGDALVVHCDACGEVSVPADVWDVGRRILDGGYQTVFTVALPDSEESSEEESSAAWKGAEDRAFALLQILDALPSLIERLREDAAEGESVPAVDGLDLVLGDRRVWEDPDADPNQENGIYEVTVHDPPGCEVSPTSSAACERGTKGCILSHTGAP